MTEVVKREVLEGEKADTAGKQVSKAASLSLSKRPTSILLDSLAATTKLKLAGLNP